MSNNSGICKLTNVLSQYLRCKDNILLILYKTNNKKKL